MKKKCYHVIQEWLYPRGNGGGAVPQGPDGPFTSLADAEAAALGIAEAARENFADETGSDPLPVARLAESKLTPPEKTVFVVSAKGDPGSWWFAVKVIELEKEGALK